MSTLASGVAPTGSLLADGLGALERARGPVVSRRARTETAQGSALGAWRLLGYERTHDPHSNRLHRYHLFGGFAADLASSGLSGY
jgi:hypothetical protein